MARQDWLPLKELGAIIIDLFVPLPEACLMLRMARWTDQPAKKLAHT